MKRVVECANYFERLEADPSARLATEIRTELGRLESNYGQAVTELRTKYEALDAHRATTDEGLEAAKRDAADAAAKLSEALAKLEGADRAQKALELQIEEFTRSGLTVPGAAGDERAQAELLQEHAHLVSMREFLANNPTEHRMPSLHVFGDEDPPSPADITEVRRYRAGYQRYLRARESNFRALSGTMPDETFAVGSSAWHPSFGFAVPVTYTNRMIQELFTAGTLRGLALVRGAVGNTVHLMHISGKVAMSVGNEHTAYTPGELPQGFDIQYGVNKWVATVSLTSDTLEDVPDLAGFLATQAGARYAELEGDKHINGTGVDQPLGILQTPKSDNAIDALTKTEAPIGTIKAVKSGQAAAIHDTSKAAAGYNFNPIVHAIYNLHGRYRPRAVIMLNRLSYATVLLMRGDDGQYMLPVSVRDSGAMSIFGHRVVINDHMPDIAANAYPVLVGDLSQGYEIADRRGMMALIDPYSSKPDVEYTFTWRSGGRPADTRALRLIKCAA